MLALPETGEPTRLQVEDEISLQSDSGGRFMGLWRDEKPLLVDKYDKLRMIGSERLTELDFLTLVYEKMDIEKNRHFLFWVRIVAKK